MAVHFDATDTLSGIDGLATFDTTVSAEGRDQSVEHTFADVAGNTRSATVTAINIDLTSPRTTATPSPAANASGWWRTAVSVTLAATDNLSGVATTQYMLDGGVWTPYVSPVAVTTAGIHTLNYRSTDRADNQESAQTLTLRIDLTAPEAFARIVEAAEGRDVGLLIYNAGADSSFEFFVDRPLEEGEEVLHPLDPGDFPIERRELCDVADGVGGLGTERGG